MTRRRTEPAVLIVADRVDLHADRLVECLGARGARVFRWNVADTLGDMSATWRLDGTGAQWRLAARKAAHCIAAGEIRSAVYRQTQKPRPLSAPDSDAVSEFVCQEVKEFAGGMYRSIDCAFWINDPKSLENAFWRMPQLALAATLGFRVPRTVVTNDPHDAAEFLADLPPAGACVKRLSNARMVQAVGAGIWATHVAPPDYGDMASSVVFAPTLLQEYVEKSVELRVVLVGDRVFSSVIHSQDCSLSKHDWRRGQLHGLTQEPGEIPADVAALCRRMLDRMGLVFGAFDLVVTPTGEYVFLEVNPTGQWLWMETDLGLPIAAAFCDLLLDPSSGAAPA